MRSCQRFRRVERLKESSDFERVYRAGSLVQNEYLRLYVLDQEQDAPARLGLTVTKRLGKAAVRNRLKRLIREWFRTRKEWFRGLDLVIQPKPSAAHLTPEALWESLERLAASLKLD